MNRKKLTICFYTQNHEINTRLSQDFSLSRVNLVKSCGFIIFFLLLVSCLLPLQELYASPLSPHALSGEWSEAVIIDSGHSNAYRTDIAFDSRGNAIAVFEQKSDDIYRIFASSYINGEGWQGAVAIDSDIGNAYRGQVAFDREGNAIAVFKQEINPPESPFIKGGKEGGFYRVYANYYKAVPVNSVSVSKKNPITDTDTDTHTYTNIGWQGAVPIDNDTGMVDGQDIVFDSEGNAAAVFEAQDGEEMGIYVNRYLNGKGWQGSVRIDKDKSSILNIQSSINNAYFPYAIFDDKDNLYVLYYKEEAGGLEAYVSRLNLQEAIRESKSQRVKESESGGKIQDAKGNDPSTGWVPQVESSKLSAFRLQPSALKNENWAEKKSEVRRGIKAVYNPNFLSEFKKRLYSGNYSYSRWETPSKLDSRFRDAYRPTLLVNGSGELTALFVRWDGEYLSAYAASYKNGKWGKPEEIDAGKGDVEHIRGAVNSEGEIAAVWTQWANRESESQRVKESENGGKRQEARGNENLRIHARIKNSVKVSESQSVKVKNTDTDTSSGWGEAKIIDAGKKDGYNPSVAFTKNGEIIAVWCQWEKANVKSYSNIYRKRNNPLTPFIKGEGWGKAERIENKDGETCGVRIVSGPDGKSIAIFEQEESESQRRINRIFAVEYQRVKESESQSVKAKNSGTDNFYTIKRLTDGDRENYYAEFSPDGKKIVFVSRHGKFSNLYIMDANGENRRQLTYDDVSDTAPAFTPDGKRIIFTSNRTDESLPLNDSIRGWDIWSINTDGTGLTRITKDKMNELAPRPTPDGKNIVFISTAGGDHAIWSMDINGDNPKRLTSGGTGDWFPAMNPDGKELVFVSTRLGQGDIWTIDSLEKKYHRLTYTELPEFSPAWSPDGSRIAFVTNKGGSFEIWVMDRDGANKKRLTKGISDGNWGSRFSSRKILETAGYYHLSWHHDGTKILFTEWGDENQESESQRVKESGSYISILEFDKNVIERLEVDSTPIHDYTLIGEKELTAGEWEDFAPSFSPDGTSLTFSSNRSGNWDIWRLRIEDCRLKIEDCKSMVDSEKLEQITKGDDDELAPVYSPDGKEIAFLKSQRVRESESQRIKKEERDSENLQSSIFNLQYSLWIMKSDGSGAKQVTEGIPVLSYPAWHPDGKEIVFVTKGNDGHEIWTYNIHDSRLTTHNLQLTIHDSQLTTHDSLNYPFTKFLYRIGYNPTGDKITFESNRSGNIEIWTMKSDGTNLARITNGDGPHWNPVWSPDGKRIAYTTDKLGEEAGLHNWRNYNIWVANPETQKEMLITGEEQVDWNPVWSPDGKKIVYVTNRSGDLKHFSLWVLYLK